MQSAYRLVVASSRELAEEGKGDLWDTGKVASSQSTQIEYKGTPLRSRQRAFWRVMVWDEAGKPSAWSKTQWWEMGLLNRGDWKAQWIGRAEGAKDSFADLKTSWIWYPEGNPLQSAPAGNRFFRLTFETNTKSPIERASLYAVADNSFTAFANGTAVGSGGAWQNWSRVALDKSLVSGKNVIALSVNNTDGPAGLAAVVVVHYANGTTQRLTTDALWKSQNTEEPNWQKSSFNDSQWKPALAFAPLGVAPWGSPKVNSTPPPASYLQREFEIGKEIAQARVYATAKGLYHLLLNGKRIGADELTPGWTEYRQRIQYQTYDVTQQIKQGKNSVQMVLGDGWYTGHIAWAGRQNYGLLTRGLLQLEIVYTDGDRATYTTDSSWKAAEGAILSSDLLMGEEYDARKEAKDWKPVLVEPLGTERLEASVGSSVRRYTEIKPLTLKRDKNGAYVYDLGQNMVGWVRLKVQGTAGTRVQLRFAEMLNPDGTIYTTNLRAARATDTYILNGKGTERYEPSFTFHGFRYVEVTGLRTPPTKETVTGVVITSAHNIQGDFSCSNPLVNQLQHNIVWGQLGNYLEVPTDCPQRDERLGWMGDAQVFIRTACFNADLSAFMTKWVQDVREAQAPDGGYSDVSPYLSNPGNAAPAWGDAGVIVPYTVYRFYEDRRLLERHYPSMVRWVEYVHSANPDLLWRNKVGNNYGDWLSIGADTPRDVLSTAYFAYSTKLLARSAEALGKRADAEKYNTLFEQIRAAFQKEFVAADGRIKGNTQSCYLVALHFDLLPTSLRSAAARYLADDIRQKGTHLSTGFVGVGYLNPVLTAEGYADLAYRLLLTDTYPSWGYSIRQGATTIWERWDGWTTEKGFQDPGMNSFNHYSLGSVGEWLFSTVAGIDLLPNRVGFQQFRLQPQPGGGLTFANAALDSAYGRIASHWKYEKARWVWTVTVPANTTATVVIPKASASTITESGRPLHSAQGVKVLQQGAEGTTLQVGAGTYTFSTPTK
jgi:alpha-L-rhamnosidase